MIAFHLKISYNVCSLISISSRYDKFTLYSVSSTVVTDNDLFAVCDHQNIKIGTQRIQEWAKYNDRIAILMAR